MEEWQSGFRFGALKKNEEKQKKKLETRPSFSNLRIFGFRSLLLTEDRDGGRRNETRRRVRVRGLRDIHFFFLFFLRIEKREGRTKCRRETVNERVGRSGEGEEET